MLSLLLDWFLCEDDDGMITMIAQLIQVTGGHSVTGKDLRKFFALLRNEKIQSKRNYYALLLTCLEAMLREKGPTAFFEFNGFDSVSLYILKFSVSIDLRSLQIFLKDFVESVDWDLGKECQLYLYSDIARIF